MHALTVVKSKLENDNISAKYMNEDVRRFGF